MATTNAPRIPRSRAPVIPPAGPGRWYQRTTAERVLAIVVLAPAGGIAALALAAFIARSC